MAKRGIFVLGLVALVISFARAQESVTPFMGYHAELIRSNTSTPVSVNVSLRPDGDLSRTIDQTFGRYNEVGLKEGSAESREADIVWVKEGGRWLQFYYNGGWRAVGFRNSDMSGYMLPHTGGFFIESRSSTNWLAAFGGYVRRDPMVYNVTPGFNILNRGFPLPIPLHRSGIERSEGFGSEDIVWLYNGDSYDRYYYDNGWKKFGSSGDYGSAVIPSTLVIQPMGPGGRVILRPPRGLQPPKTLPRRTAVPPPPVPNVGMAFTQNERGTELFQISWNAFGPKVRYHTEVLESDWFEISSKVGQPSQVLEDHAIMVTAAGRIRLWWGIVRVRAEWAHPFLNKAL